VGAIRYEVDDRVATITIDRPEKRNAMTYAVLREFHEAVARAGADDAVHAVVLTGAGGAFCAGTDLSDLAATPEEDRSGAGRPRDGSRAEPWPLVACPKPVVAAVDGPAVGMGAEFATQCDVRLASDRARFGWNFVQRGLVPDTGAGSFLLPRLIGPSAALRLLLSGELIDAAEALRLGFVAAVVRPDELAAAAEAEARRYPAASPFAVRRVKALVYAGLARPVDEHLRETGALLEECFRSEDHREGVAAFLERREARFTGR
jgi:2-(1,2-epoxy-1,2-dihydrophenyl)acetyl-CoA isomerase